MAKAADGRVAVRTKSERGLTDRWPAGCSPRPNFLAHRGTQHNGLVPLSLLATLFCSGPTDWLSVRSLRAWKRVRVLAPQSNGNAVWNSSTSKSHTERGPAQRNCYLFRFQ